MPLEPKIQQVFRYRCEGDEHPQVEEVSELPGHNMGVSDIAVNSVGTTVGGKTIDIGDIDHIAILTREAGRYNVLISVGSAGGKIHFTDLATDASSDTGGRGTKRPVRRLIPPVDCLYRGAKKTYLGCVTAMQLSEDGSYLAYGTSSGYVGVARLVCDVEESSLRLECELRGVLRCREYRAIWWMRVERGAVVRRVERLEIPQSSDGTVQSHELPLGPEGWADDQPEPSTVNFLDLRSKGTLKLSPVTICGVATAALKTPPASWHDCAIVALPNGSIEIYRQRECSPPEMPELPIEVEGGVFDMFKSAASQHRQLNVAENWNQELLTKHYEEPPPATTAATQGGNATRPDDVEMEGVDGGKPSGPVEATGPSSPLITSTQPMWTKERATRLRKKQERLSQEANAYDTIRMCYRRGLEKLVYNGEISKDTASRWAKIDAQLVELQSRPRQLMVHDARQRMFQHYIREHFPKKPLEKESEED
ncbi:hypothetical protein Pmar_PMAR009760 [Perkinsus marinus ATCC 50983]|uniref:Uncharacterized protein n=1 Tax=Perkinsus marinus (strain ATCC 50983 / TXsc) TaxID=423536 RepID=C5KZG6_PERM5|nr:hypothetical protein Pmar_PMAR009760 [Perkinsus marinus ATCC 50983]EER10126.1 hypothetical protein Pmar_PMAR009760 [Perkinsus marinus ATCC 50983]|eukprot:XP_002778331.1 hypothetical protein Pmar_PMAR009760 [Perkinsus marinus ATCC 50983]